MRHALYLIGEPGSGKSTLAAGLTDGWPASELGSPFAHRIYDEPDVVELGKRRDNGFSGTDALGMTVITQADPFVRDPDFFTPNNLLAEGDRLAVNRFFEALEAGGWELVVGWLSTPRELAAERRRERAERLGLELQSPTFIKGRISKVERLADAWSHRLVVVNGVDLELGIKELTEKSPVARNLIHGITERSTA